MSSNIFVSQVLILAICTLFSRYVFPNEGLIFDQKASISDTLLINNLIQVAETFDSKQVDSACFYLQQALDITNQAIGKSSKGKNQEIFYRKKALITYQYAINKYSLHSWPEANDLLDQSLDCNIILTDSMGLYKTLLVKGLNFYAMGDFIKALECYQNGLKIGLQFGLKKELSSIYVNLGNLYQSMGKYIEAMNAYQSSIEIKEQFNDAKGLLAIYNNVGALHYNRNEFNDAIAYHKKFISVSSFLCDSLSVAKGCNNLGLDYMGLGQTDSAERYFNQASQLFKTKGDIVNQAISYSNMGELHLSRNEFAKAELFFRKSLALREASGTENTSGFPLINLANTYLKQNKFSEAISTSYKALSIGQKTDNLVIQQNACLVLFKSYEQTQNFQKAFEYCNRYQIIKDSILDNDKNNAISLVESRYQNQIQLHEIETQKIMLEKRNLEILQNESKSDRYRLVRNIFIFGFLFLLIVVGVFINLWLTKLKLSVTLAEQKQKINEKNHSLEQLNHEIMAQNNQIEEQNTILIDQKNSIQQIHSQLQESLFYAQNIQYKGFPSQQELKTWFKEYFILMQPKEEVGGDFYWAFKRDEEILVAVGDSTGHGVPGGFLSMLVIALLKGIAKNSTDLDPAAILNQLRNEVIESLKQTQEKFEITDGVDMSLIRINNQTNELTFAGAKSRILVLNENRTEILKGQHYSVAYCPRMKEFTNQTIQLESGSLVYLFTDGYCDQFNTTNEKFGRKQFIDICRNNFDKPLSAQREILYHTFNQWKGNFEQLDDVLVFCFKLV